MAQKLRHSTWFHWTGITPELGIIAQKVLKQALIAVKSKNVKVSCDLNFWKKMWTTEEAQSVMIQLMEYVDKVEKLIRVMVPEESKDKLINRNMKWT